ncbi:hypothetical protein PG997_002711 [Apiospora hydei]|uniref:BSD domain-containing protein n=1 Tax=Apiospora hydei TaxID=1337664 RepID=A0ABR1WX77_9PEZI
MARGGEPLDAEAAEEVQEEDRFILEVHRRLVLDFEREFSATVEISPLNIGQFEKFWGDYWLVRIEEELAELNRDVMSEDAKHAAEEVGVIWDVAESASSGASSLESSDDEQETWEYWFDELDKIVPPENHEIGEIRQTW